MQRALADLARQGLRTELDGRSLILDKLSFSEVTVDGHEPPQALLHVEASGTWGAASIGYYGGERVSFGGRFGHLTPPELWLPKLAGVLRALAARDVALEAHDAEGLAKLAGAENHDGAVTLPRILAVQQERAPDSGAAGPSLSIRVDRDRAQVSQIRDGPGPRSASLVLVGDSWRFTTGLL